MNSGWNLESGGALAVGGDAANLWQCVRADHHAGWSYVHSLRYIYTQLYISLYTNTLPYIDVEVLRRTPFNTPHH
jgi:hypothetical protein